MELTATDGQSPPQAGWVASTVAAGCCLLVGTLAWLGTGDRWWELVGVAGTAILLGARLHYRVLRALLPCRSEEPEVLSGRVRELLLAIGVFGPCVVGIATWAGTHDWRWAVTGLTVGAVMPAVALLPMPRIGTAVLPSAEFVFGAMLLAVGLPGVLLGWLWTTDVSVVFYGSIIIVGGALLSLLTAALVADADQA